MNSSTYIDLLLIQMAAMGISLLALSNARPGKLQLVLLGSVFHGSLSIALFGLWGQFVRSFLI